LPLVANASELNLMWFANVPGFVCWTLSGTLVVMATVVYHVPGQRKRPEWKTFLRQVARILTVDSQIKNHYSGSQRYCDPDLREHVRTLLLLFGV